MSAKGLSGKSARGLFWLMSGRGIYFGINLVVLARLLSPAEFGVVGVVWCAVSEVGSRVRCKLYANWLKASSGRVMQ